MNEQDFFAYSIPQVLEPLPKMGKVVLTTEHVKAIMKHDDRAIFRVAGDCLEGMGVMDGGWVAVDFKHFPAPPRYKSNGGDSSMDACMCYAVYPGQHIPSVMFKAYDGVWGPWQMVGTRYDLSKGKHTMNCCMEAIRIFGVVFASWDAVKGN